MGLSNYQHFIEDYFSIVNKSGQTVPFVLNTVQQKLIEGITGRDVILKARQEGVSSILLAIFTVDFLLKRNSRSVVISHEASATAKLFDRVKFFISSFEEKKHGKVIMKYSSRHEMVNEQMNSTFYIQTAGSKSALRGDTVTNLHFSEPAFYEHPEEVVTGAMQAVPKEGRIMLESTANGMGNYFHKVWQEASEGVSVFKPHFYSFRDSPEYSLPVAHGEIFNLTHEEQNLIERHNLTREQIKWRREKIAELPDKKLFDQEYPISSSVAFLTSGRPYFDRESLNWYLHNKIKEPTKTGYLVGDGAIDEDIEGYVKIFKEPEQSKHYYLSADVGEMSDFSSAGVIDSKTFDIVATWHGHMDAGSFGRQLYLLGKYYNWALVAVERNNQGLAVILTLRDMSYPYQYTRIKQESVAEPQSNELGWLTTSSTRPLMLADLRSMVKDRSLGIYDKTCIEEMMSFVRDEKTGRPQAIEGCFDDRVIMLAILARLAQEQPQGGMNEDQMQEWDQWSLESSKKSEAFRIGR